MLAFNGTTEWALDSLETESAVWLPREDQLRELLGRRFERLERLDSPTGPAYAVVLTDGTRHLDNQRRGRLCPRGSWGSPDQLGRSER